MPFTVIPRILYILIEPLCAKSIALVLFPLARDRQAPPSMQGAKLNLDLLYAVFMVLLQIVRTWGCTSRVENIDCY